MEKKLLVVLVVVGLCGTVAFALDPMGPPTAGLKAGQFSAGLEYAYSQMDLKHDGKFSWNLDYGWYTDVAKLKYKQTNSQMHKAYFNLGYGVADCLEAFVRLGGANLYGKRKPMSVYNYDYTDLWMEETIYDSDTGFAVGFGGKATIWEPCPECKVGILAQGSWATVNYDIYFEGESYNGPDAWWGGQSKGDMNFWEWVLAIGATYELAPRFSVYGGPFYYWFSGEFDHKTSDGDYYMYGPDSWYNLAFKGDYDVEDVGCFGGYIGAKVDLTENASFTAECQLAQGAMGLGTGITWKF